MLHNAIDAQDLIDLKILLIIAICLLFSPHLAKFFRLSVSASELILGSVFAYFGLVGESENFKLLAGLGFYYLMFLAGMEVNLRSFFEMENTLAKKSFYYIFLLYLFSLIFVFIFNFHYVLILIIPVMSVGLLSMLFKDFGRQEYWLNVSMLIATLAEVISIILLALAGAFFSENSTLFDALKSLFYLNIFLIICLICFKFLNLISLWFPNFKAFLNDEKNEKDTRFCLAIFILVVVAMMLSGIEIALGSFIAGSFITTFFTQTKEMERKISSFGYGFLIPIFFIYIGSTFDLKILNLQIILNALLLSFSMIIIRVLSACVFLRQIRIKNTILFGLSHSMPLTLLIAAATLFYSAKIIDLNLYSSLILTALFEAIFVMSAIKFVSKCRKK